MIGAADAVAVLAGLGAAIVGGTYAGFATIVMPGLRRLPAGDAAAAMQAMNVAVLRGPFIGAFGFAAITAVALGVVAVPHLPDPDAALMLVASACSFGSTIVTVIGNVPLNNRIEREGADFWPRFQRSWGRLNIARAVLALVAVVALLATTAVG